MADAGLFVMPDREVELIFGQYYWVKPRYDKQKWEVCLCAKSYTGLPEFLIMNDEATAYPLDAIIDIIHIPFPDVK